MNLPEGAQELFANFISVTSKTKNITVSHDGQHLIK
jgi:hypothetical protein